MVWCGHCLADSPTELDPYHGYVCCTGCGKVVDQESQILMVVCIIRCCTGCGKVVDQEAQVGYNSATSEGSKIPGGLVRTGRRAVDRPAYRATRVLNATTSCEDNFSDIDDREVARYLHSEKETRYKAMIWEVMNKDYLKEQEAKVALGLAKSTDASTKSSKDRKRRYSQNTPAHAVAKATNEVVDLKGHSSKINYGALRSLLDQEKDKKARTETYPVGADANAIETGVGEIESRLNARKGEGDETTAYEDIDYELLWE